MIYFRVPKWVYAVCGFLAGALATSSQQDHILSTLLHCGTKYLP